MAIWLLREKFGPTRSGRAPFEIGVETAVDTARIAFKDLGLVRCTQGRKSVDIAAGIVEVIAGFRIDAADRSDHLRGKQDVFDGDDLCQKLDAGTMIDAGIEKDILQQ